MADNDRFYDGLAACLQLSSQQSLSSIRMLLRQIQGWPAAPSHSQLQALQTTILGVLPDGGRFDLVYGGPTRIKGYVFEAPRLPEIRGASALLDYVNQIEPEQLWRRELGTLLGDAASASQCIIYSSGGNILACAPAGMGAALANQLEQAFTEATLTAQSVAVAGTFHLLELRYGRLQQQPDGGLYWVDQFVKDWSTPDLQKLLEPYYYKPLPGTPIALLSDQDVLLALGHTATSDDPIAIARRFLNRKSFGELVTVLATQFNRRRDEQQTPAAMQPRHPALFAMNPWAEKCDSSDIRPAVIKTEIRTEERKLSAASARKVVVGHIIKKGDQDAARKLEQQLGWHVPDDLKEHSWEYQWQEFLTQAGKDTAYANHPERASAKPANDVEQISAASGGYIGMLYADGNNVGRLIATLRTPQEYQNVSQALESTAKDVIFQALAMHLKPVQVREYDRKRKQQNTYFVHPFEILTIGGDDLILIVPGKQASDIALTIGQLFEQQLAEKLSKLGLARADATCVSDRYHRALAAPFADLKTQQPSIGLSAGLVIAQHHTPIFFLQRLVKDLQKNAKKRAHQEATKHFFGGAIDFMAMKSISMVTDNIIQFRSDALGDTDASPVRLTARPYTWHEFAGLLTTIRALQQAHVPRSQLYRLRGIFQRALQIDITPGVMEYLYTRVRVDRQHATALMEHVEQAWKQPGSHLPNATPPWMPVTQPACLDQREKSKRAWETVWADMLELHDFVKE